MLQVSSLHFPEFLSFMFETGIQKIKTLQSFPVLFCSVFQDYEEMSPRTFFFFCYFQNASPPIQPLCRLLARKHGQIVDVRREVIWGLHPPAEGKNCVYVVTLFVKCCFSILALFVKCCFLLARWGTIRLTRDQCSVKDMPHHDAFLALVKWLLLYLYWWLKLGDENSLRIWVMTVYS